MERAKGISFINSVAAIDSLQIQLTELEKGYSESSIFGAIPKIGVVLWQIGDMEMSHAEFVNAVPCAHPTFHSNNSEHAVCLEAASLEALTLKQTAHSIELELDPPEIDKVVRSGSTGMVDHTLPMRINGIELVKLESGQASNRKTVEPVLVVIAARYGMNDRQIHISEQKSGHCQFHPRVRAHRST